MQSISGLYLVIFCCGLKHTSARRKSTSDEGQELEVGKPTVSGGSYLCQDLDRMGKADKTEVDIFLKQRALVEEFVALTTSLQNTAGAWHGGYKGSSLSRTMLLGGHDAAFAAK